MKKLVITFVCILSLFSSVGAQRKPKTKSSPKRTWKLLTVTNNAVNVVSLRRDHTSQGTIKVWVKRVEKTEIDETLKENQTPQELVERNNNYEYKLRLFECNCKTRMVKMLLGLSYGRDGKVTPSEIPDAGWIEAPPTTVVGDLIEEVCKRAK